MRIRAETSADSERIEALTVAAFSSALHTSHTEQHIVDALRRAGKLSVSLVAESEGALIGHVAISPVAISDYRAAVQYPVGLTRPGAARSARWPRPA